MVEREMDEIFDRAHIGKTGGPKLARVYEMTDINVLHCSRTLSFLITPDDLECQVGGWQKEGGVTEKDCEICGHLALAMATKELAHDYGEEMTTIEVMDADGVRAELDAVSESV